MQAAHAFEMEFSLEWQMGAVTSSPAQAPSSRRQRTFSINAAAGVDPHPGITTDRARLEILLCFYYTSRQTYYLNIAVHLRFRYLSLSAVRTVWDNVHRMRGGHSPATSLF